MSSAATNDQPDERRRHDQLAGGAHSGTSTFATLRRTVTEFSEDNLSDWAAALTYYGLLALFPALIAMVALIGLVGDPTTTTNTITQIVTKIGPGSAAQTFAGPIKSITSHKSTQRLKELERENGRLKAIQRLISDTTSRTRPPTGA